MLADKLSRITYYIALLTLAIITVFLPSVIPTLGVFLLGFRHALEEILGMIAEATPVPVDLVDVVCVLAAVITIHVGACAGIKLVRLSEVRNCVAVKRDAFTYMAWPRYNWTPARTKVLSWPTVWRKRFWPEVRWIEICLTRLQSAVMLVAFQG